jgi:hypothetical protein
MQKEEEIKSKVEIYFFSPQDGIPEFSCQASSLSEAEEKYAEFKKNK